MPSVPVKYYHYDQTWPPAPVVGGDSSFYYYRRRKRKQVNPYLKELLQNVQTFLIALKEEQVEKK